MESPQKLIGRDEERRRLRRILLTPLGSKSHVVVISGDSGTGKTFFTKSVLSEILNDNSGYYCCYIDMDSKDLNANSLFEILTYYSWIETMFSKALLQVPEGMSISQYLKKQKYKKVTKEKIIATLNKSLSIIPVYGAMLNDIIPAKFNSDLAETSDLSGLYFRYLKSISKKNRIIIIIDNYQFLNEVLRTKTEALFSEVVNNACLIVLDRTLNGNSEIRKPLCHIKDQTYIEMHNVSIEETKKLIQSYIPNVIEEAIIQRVQSITSGNPKLIELASRNILYSMNRNIIISETTYNLSAAISCLPDIERYVLIIAAFFPAGLRTTYLECILRSIIAANSTDKLKQSLTLLTSLGYIYINSSNGDLLKPTHEKIITTIKEAIHRDEFIDVYNTITVALEELLHSNRVFDETEYDYLLFCLISMYSTSQLKHRTSFIIELINRFHTASLYNYLASLYNDIKEVLHLIPESSIEKILDSFQKTSLFYDGLDAVTVLKSYGSFSDTIQLFYAKFLTQTYDFTYALSIINQLPESMPVLLCKLNILQHLQRDDEAANIINSTIKEKDKYSCDEYYIMLRNSAHHFPTTYALTLLHDALNYFDEKDAKFVSATVLNNLGVVHLWKKDTFMAKQYLMHSVEIFESLGSNELFECLFNLSVLFVFEKQFTKAIKYGERALDVLPKVLWMDVIVLQMNIEIIYYLAKKHTLTTTFTNMQKLFDKTRKCNDPWIKQVVLFNLLSLSRRTDKKIDLVIDRKILDAIYSDKRTRFDVVYNPHSTTDQSFDFLFALSPNWRY